MDQEGAFISTQELDAVISRKQRVFVIDGTIQLTGNALDSFIAKRIPGARFFNQLEIRDKQSSHPLAYVSAEEFSRAMMSLRIPNDGSLIVVYDQEGMRTAPRVWFLLRYYGYPRVRFLRGGLPKWESEGRPIDSGPIKPFTCQANPKLYRYVKHHGKIANFEEVKELGPGRLS